MVKVLKKFSDTCFVTSRSATLICFAKPSQNIDMTEVDFAYAKS